MVDDSFDGDLGELDALLTDSIDYKKSEELKKRKAKVGMPDWRTMAKQVEAKKIQKAEVKVDWRPIAAIAMFYEQVCLKCGSRHRHFEGFFQHQQHKWQQHSFKYVPASDHTMTDGLPHYTKIVETSCDVCNDCIDKSNWVDENLYLAERETPHIGSWSPHKSNTKQEGQNDNGWFPSEFHQRIR